MPYSDVRRVLEAHGWIMRKGGKHTAVYTRPGYPGRLTIPTVSGRAVKRYILDQILEALDLGD